MAMKRSEFWQNMGLGLAGLLIFYGLLYYARTHIETAPLNLTTLNSTSSSPIEKIRTIFTAPVIKNVTLPPLFSGEDTTNLASTTATSTATTTVAETATSTLNVTMNVGSLVYYLSLQPGSTIYDVLKETGTSTTNTDIFFQTEYLANILSVEEINGQPNFPPYYWTYYINGVIGTSSISDYRLQDKDVIDWKLQ